MEIWESTEVSSIELHPYGVHFLSERTNIDYGAVHVVMKDGTIIPLNAEHFEKRCIYDSAEWIDPNQVDYFLLQDGTKIPVPEN